MDPAESLLNFFQSRYTQKTAYPALAAQWELWSRTKPLQGVKVLDGTPLFFNTFGKYTGLLLAGAELTVAYSPELPYDPEALALLASFGVPTVKSPGRESGTYDVVLDCAGLYQWVPSRFGYAELTRSGIHMYQGRDVPLFAVDSGRIKQIETCLGTGESCLRALRHLGYREWDRVPVLQFGYGKVGRGIAMYLRDAGADVTVVDKKTVPVMPGIRRIDMEDTDAVRSAIDNTQWIIAVTGVPAVLAPYVEPMRNSQALLVNMGALDEFGDAMPPERVLYGKQPLNFMLDEPTELRYIDVTMALDNAAAEYLYNGGTPRQNGVILPPEELENMLLKPVFETNLIANEIRKAGI